jgi:hypothetical protein
MQDPDELKKERRKLQQATLAKSISNAAPILIGIGMI